MPRGSNLDRVRGDKEKLAARFGVTPLRPGEGAREVWVRAPLDVLARFEALPAATRGAVIRAGLEALGLSVTEVVTKREGETELK